MVHTVVIALIGLSLVALGILIAFSGVANVDWGFCVVIGVFPICGASNRDVAQVLALASTVLGLISLLLSYAMIKSAQRAN